MRPTVPEWGRRLVAWIHLARAGRYRQVVGVPTPRHRVDGANRAEAEVGALDALPDVRLEDLLVGLTPETAHREISTGPARGVEHW
ncbi:MAG TPA: hypothetical protein VM536_18885 [Chloroflexia bacterium]|nr:hypothetical protein [Chloroflexia bacterium]